MIIPRIPLDLVSHAILTAEKKDVHQKVLVYAIPDLNAMLNLELLHLILVKHVQQIAKLVIQMELVNVILINVNQAFS